MAPDVRGQRGESGYAMAALLVAMAIMAVFLSVALPAWRTASQREKETELIFRGQQYARAVALFQRKYANTFPPNVDVLLNEHFLRKKYKDPMTADGEFQVLSAAQQASAQPSASGTVPTQGQPAARPATQAGAGAAGPVVGGIIGVASKSTAASIRVYNGHGKYSEWTFVATQVTSSPSAPNGSLTPTGGLNLPGGAGGRGGQPQPGGGRGGQPQFPGGRGQNPNQPGGRAQNPNQPGQRGGAGAPPPGSPFGGMPIGGGVFGGGPGRGR
jgi:type II secretory pathway pseudopilin PulG